MEQTIAFLLRISERYPLLEPADLLKALHQSVFGCGHFVESEEECLRRILEELETVPPEAPAAIEPLDGPYCRLPLAYLHQSGLAPKTLARLFFLSAQGTAGEAKDLEDKLSALQALAGALPCGEEALLAAIADYRKAGFPVCRHSPAYRAAYHPAYRVIRRELVWLLPLLARIDGLCREKSHVMVALEGGSASGKTTLAAVLAKLYGCPVIHADDFFLRPEQRTQERFDQPGGNMDRERLAQQVLAPLRRGETAEYIRFDCQTQQLLAPRPLAPAPLMVVEGAYCMHPQLTPYYDLSVFLRISPEGQKERIRRRNTPPQQEQFFDRWIPLEQRYFEAMDPMGRCDLCLCGEDGEAAQGGFLTELAQKP